MLTVLKLRIRRFKDEYIILAIMTGLALFISFFFGLFQSTEYHPLVTIVDQSSTPQGIYITEALENLPNYDIRSVSYDEGVDLVEEGKAVLTIVIPEGYDFSQAIGMFKVKDSVEYFYVQQEIQSLVSAYQYENQFATGMVAAGLGTKEAVTTAYRDELVFRNPIDVNVTNTGTGEGGFDFVMHMTIGMTLFMSTYTMVFGAGEMLFDKKWKTWDRQLIGPLKNYQILGGNFLGTLLLGTLQISIILLAGQLLFGIQWGNRFPEIIAVALVYIFAMSSLGLVIVGLVKTHDQLAAMTPVILTSMGMLGGCMWPLEIISFKPLLTVAAFTPHKWAMEAISGAVMYNSDISVTLTSIGVILAMGIIFFVTGVQLMRAKRLT